MICANGKMFLVMLIVLLPLKWNLPAALPEKHVCVDGKTRDVRTSGDQSNAPISHISIKPPREKLDCHRRSAKVTTLGVLV